MSGWDTWDDWPIEQETRTQSYEVGEFTKDNPCSDDQKLSEAFQDVILSDTRFLQSKEKDVFPGKGVIDGDNDGDNEYPLRPYAEDCAFYMKTGTCKFKSVCKFNHPVRRTNKGSKLIEGFVEQSQQTATIDCKYYLTSGGCRNGEACKFRHSMDQDRMEHPELNFLGLPMRLGEKECLFYMRTGSCAYGAKCKFHHPEPTDWKASDPEKKSQDDSSGKESGSWEKLASEPDLLPESVEPKAEPWAPHMIMKESAFYMENHLYSSPDAVASSEEQWGKDWNHYQTPNLSHEESDQAALNTQMNDALEKNVGTQYYLCSAQFEKFPERPGLPECSYYMKTGDCKFGSACRYHHPKNLSSKLHIGPLKDSDMNQRPFYELEKIRRKDPASEGYDMNAFGYHQQRQIGEFPERPGHPECSYFMKTGDCKFRSACRYHHPKDRLSTGCSLNDKGLPLRPARKACNNFKQYGICKFGRLCLFDHGDNPLSLSSLAGSNSDVSSESESETFEESKPSDSGQWK